MVTRTEQGSETATVVASGGLTGFGRPLEKNGAMIIPVGGRGRASGVYVLDGKHTTWIPALDLNRMIPVMLLGEIVALSMLRIMRELVKHQQPEQGHSR